ncbi:MAG: prolipoprotein diacylglyceryl transferase [Cytophagaceae bacterium]
MLNFVIWEASPDLFSIGPLTVRWYGLLFALGFLIGQQILIKIYKGEGKSEKHVETLTIYMVIATILGARLGHCLFYEPEVYLNDPLRILKIWEGGLASHGATAGILLAIYLYSRKQLDQSYLYVLDRIVIVIALAGCLIRLGNLMNSEIIGKPTDFKGGFIFTRSVSDHIYSYQPLIEDISYEFNGKDSTDVQGRKLSGMNMSFFISQPDVPAKRVEAFIQESLRKTLEDRPGEHHDHLVLPNDYIPFTIQSTPKGAAVTLNVWGIPRHPAQLYESISSLLLFFFLMYLYSRKKSKTREGRLFGLFVVILFSLRFVYEFLKEPQVAFEQQMTFNMGQLLSIPLIIVGIFILLRSFRKHDEIS